MHPAVRFASDAARSPYATITRGCSAALAMRPVPWTLGKRAKEAAAAAHEEEEETTRLYEFAATIFLPLTTTTTCAQHVSKLEFTAASEPINPTSSPTPKACPLGPFVHESKRGLPTVIAASHAVLRSPPSLLLAVRHGRFRGMVVTTEDEKAEMLRELWAGRVPCLVNPSVLIACGLLVANPNKVGAYWCQC